MRLATAKPLTRVSQTDSDERGRRTLEGDSYFGLPKVAVYDPPVSIELLDHFTQRSDDRCRVDVLTIKWQNSNLATEDAGLPLSGGIRK